MLLHNVGRNKLSETKKKINNSGASGNVILKEKELETGDSWKMQRQPLHSESLILTLNKGELDKASAAAIWRIQILHGLVWKLFLVLIIINWRSSSDGKVHFNALLHLHIYESIFVGG